VPTVISKPITSKFILVSDDDESEKDSDYESDNESVYSGADDLESVSESETEVIDEPEVIDDEPEEYDNYESGGEDFYD
jgi:hypothetical protein